MTEIRKAADNAIRSLDQYINDITYDIELIEKVIHTLGATFGEFEIEHSYKCIIRQQLIDMKKNLIDIINLEKQAENAIKE